MQEAWVETLHQNMLHASPLLPPPPKKKKKKKKRPASHFYKVQTWMAARNRAN